MCCEATVTKRAVAWVGSVQPECTVPLSAWSFRNFKPEFLLNGKRPLSPGALLAVLYSSFVPYFPACLDFPSPPLSAPGSPRMWFGESRYPGALSPVLENFCRAFSLDPTDCPWVSEDVVKPSILIWRTGHVHHQMNIAWIIQGIIKWILFESSNKYFLNYQMNFVRIIEWILLKLSNEYCVNCSINVGENRKHIMANVSNFATSLLNVLNKIKYIWLLLSICGNYQTRVRNIEYWHISATIIGCVLLSVCSLCLTLTGVFLPPPF